MTAKSQHTAGEAQVHIFFCAQCHRIDPLSDHDNQGEAGQPPNAVLRANTRP
jgi:hypothetical protein